MSCRVIMFRSDATATYTIRKEYTTQIPLEMITQLALIEKRDWPLFRDSTYNMFGEFIYRNLAHYPSLTGYISNGNYKFEFIYQYITDHSEILHTAYYQNDTPITEHQYLLYTYRKYYFERWIMVDPDSNKTLIFFECEHIPVQNNKRVFIPLQS